MKRTIARFPFPSATSDAVYYVTHWDDDTLSCNCRGWIFKKPDCPVRYCKHTFQVMNQLRQSGCMVKSSTPEQEQEAIRESKRTFDLTEV